MAIGDVPQMMSSAYSSTVYDGTAAQAIGPMGLYQPSQNTGLQTSGPFGLGGVRGGYIGTQQGGVNTSIIHAAQQLLDKEAKMADPKRRLVKIIIIDPDERVPLDKCILYSGSEKLTDLTDQELFFEIDIKTLLDAHNTTRISLVDKTVKERREHLDPVKVRDLRMVVVTVAAF